MEPSTASLMHEMRKKEAPILTPLLQRKVRSDGGEQFEYDEVRPSPLLSLSTHVTRWGGGLVLQVRIFFGAEKLKMDGKSIIFFWKAYRGEKVDIFVISSVGNRS